MLKSIIRKPYDKRTRKGFENFEPSLTQQNMKQECDINNIMKKFQKTGALIHANNRSPEYGFATSQDFRESMEIVTHAQEMFDELPSSIRAKFSHNPENFLEFVQNPENASEMVSLGLSEETQPDAPVKVEVITQTKTEATAPKGET